MLLGYYDKSHFMLPVLFRSSGYVLQMHASKYNYNMTWYTYVHVSIQLSSRSNTKHHFWLLVYVHRLYQVDEIVLIMVSEASQSHLFQSRFVIVYLVCMSIATDNCAWCIILKELYLLHCSSLH